MSLILRLAASLDQRPDKVISSVQINLQENILTFELLPLNGNNDLLLEKWNLGLCRNVIKEQKNLVLKVI
jgi:exopolyphosphatase/guanosine-5'-triphosphate,3'-diphosphate pyrophosphatase